MRPSRDILPSLPWYIFEPFDSKHSNPVLDQNGRLSRFPLGFAQYASNHEIWWTMIPLPPPRSLPPALLSLSLPPSPFPCSVLLGSPWYVPVAYQTYMFGCLLSYITQPQTYSIWRHYYFKSGTWLFLVHHEVMCVSLDSCCMRRDSVLECNNKERYSYSSKESFYVV